MPESLNPAPVAADAAADPEADTDTATTVAHNGVASWYLLDAQDRVVGVCPEWDAIAQQGQSGATCLRQGVIGRPLRSFISGDTSQMFVESALQATRLTAQTRVLRYRCDTPALWRELEMHLVPMAQGTVRVEHRLLSQRPRTRPVQFATVTQILQSRGQLVRRCSQCLSVQIGEQAWKAPETLALTHYQVSYTICPRCHLHALQPLPSLPSEQQRHSPTGCDHNRR